MLKIELYFLHKITSFKMSDYILHNIIIKKKSLLTLPSYIDSKVLSDILRALQQTLIWMLKPLQQTLHTNMHE